MRHLSFSWLRFFILFIPAIGLLWFLFSKNQITQPKYYSPPKAQEYMKGVAVHRYSSTGLLNSTLTSKYWAYLPNEALSQLEQPRLLMISPNQSTWTVQAQFAHAHHPKIDEKISHIDLWDHVEIEHPNESPVFVTTQALTYYPDRSFVETKLPVQLNKPGLTITGTGLNGYLNSNWVELLNNVETIYEPDQA